jgi:hypothetical protein
VRALVCQVIEAISAQVMRCCASQCQPRPAGTATVLRLQGGDVITTPGPFSHDTEPIGGCWIIKAPDDDAALEWGRKATRANTVPCEVRPFQEETPG